jgi:hypothetical protein
VRQTGIDTGLVADNLALLRIISEFMTLISGIPTN